jgi:hypothetical protein
MNSKEIFCKDCEAKLYDEISVCPACGSTSKIVRLNITDISSITESFILKKMKKGIKRFSVESIFRHKNSRDIKKYPKGVIEERVVDRECDGYLHKITDKKTGKIVHYEKTQLSKHKQDSSG